MKKPVKPGRGYRFLKEGDVIQKGDEYWNIDYGEWVNYHNIIGFNFKPDSMIYSRRKLPPGERAFLRLPK